mmetsp:Transcript_14752/g.35047  ORF Transcript_14752/g.35047 Transcript_14752/m.35047 type:complete len:267 (-) Transcript_14752:286-1086(-)
MVFDILARPLAVDRDRGARSLGVREDGEARGVVGGEGHRHRGGEGVLGLHVEERTDHLHYPRRTVGKGVEIADGHDGHALRVVPPFVEAPHQPWRALLDHFQLAYREPFRILAPVHERGHIVLVCPPVRRPPLPPLLEDDAALLLDVLGAAAHVEGPLPQHCQALLQQAFRIDGHVQVVDGLVKRRIRVLAGTEAGTDGLEEAHHLKRVVELCATEGEVLDYVRHSLLFLALIDRPDFDDETQLRSGCWLLVRLNVVRHPVLKLAI